MGVFTWHNPGPWVALLRVLVIGTASAAVALSMLPGSDSWSPIVALATLSVILGSVVVGGSQLWSGFAEPFPELRGTRNGAGIVVVPGAGSGR